MTKMFLSYCYTSSLLLLSFLCLSASLFALSETELNQLINNAKETYIYCDKNHSRMAEVIAEISKLDENTASPVWQLHNHIKKGFSIGRQDAIVEALEYAEETLERSYQYLTDEKVEQIQTILSSVIDAVTNGKLTVNPQSFSTQTKDTSLDQDNSSLRDNVIKISRKVKFLKDVNFKKDVKFQDDVKFEDKAKFKDDATFQANVVVEGSLSAADEVINCDLTVGCNINMNDSINSSIGNILKDGSPFIHNFGGQNTFVGEEAGNFTMTGQLNSAYGAFTLSSNQNGFYNAALGLGALNSNQNGSANTAVGTISLISNTSGSANTAIGFLSMVSNGSGSGNTAIGIESLFNNSSGDDNTAVGAGALDSNTNGSNNVALGVNAGTTLVTGNNNIYIAADGTTSESGIIRIGTLNTHNQSYMQGIFGEMTAIGGLAVEVDITGKLGTQVSSSQFKRNINDMDMESANIYKLRPVTFLYNNDEANTKQYGLIAEEVAEIFPSLVVYDKDGNPYSIRYQILPVLLLNEVQKQQACIEAEKAARETLAERVALLEARA